MRFLSGWSRRLLRNMRGMILWERTGPEVPAAAQSRCVRAFATPLKTGTYKKAWESGGGRRVAVHVRTGAFKASSHSGAGSLWVQYSPVRRPPAGADVDLARMVTLISPAVLFNQMPTLGAPLRTSLQLSGLLPLGES